MMEPIPNRSQNRFQHREGTRSGTTDQSQNQIQTVLKASCGVSGQSQIQSHRYLPAPAAPIGIGAMA